jgi:hypothetical protein
MHNKKAVSRNLIPQNGEKMSQSISETVGHQACEAPKAKNNRCQKIADSF